MCIIGLMMRLIHSLLTLAAEPSGPWEGAAGQAHGWAGGKGWAGRSRPDQDPTWKYATVMLVLAAPPGRTQLLVWSLPLLCFRKTTTTIRIIINKKSSALG